jgi:hypothetical protein
MRYTITVLVAVVFLLSAVPDFSHGGDGVKVEIISDTGGLLPLIPHKGTGSGRTYVIKRYLEAKRGENYSIVVRNTLSQRIGVVIAVDGRNIITGKKSSLKSNEMMYIVDPYGSARLDGWRTDNDTVHRFYFTDVKDSYTVRTFADTSAMGVIAVAIFREKERPELFYDQQTGKEKTVPAPGAAARGEMKKQESDIAGTGFGDNKYSPVVQIEFEPEAVPCEKVLIKYEWREVLCSKGLLNCRTEGRNRLWDDNIEYAPYPPGYYDR